ncbi:unnamed protein product [Lasius platythorax]|uniref:Uncharacterized protein n=1 Tax=Lasius platythorax TaxID=488582 RepID=A0AAV2MZI2_9HYME
MRHSEAAYRVLLSSREKLDKREEIEATFRVCRDAFLEVSAVLLDMLEARSNTYVSVDDVRCAVFEALGERERCGLAGEMDRGEHPRRLLLCGQDRMHRRWALLQGRRFVLLAVLRYRFPKPQALLYCLMKNGWINMPHHRSLGRRCSRSLSRRTVACE